MSKKKKKIIEFRFVKDIANDIMYIQFKKSFNRWNYVSIKQQGVELEKLSFKKKDKAIAWILSNNDLKYEALTLLQHPSLKIV